ncbi:MAG: Holliday junction branch migration protein RuvA [Candidatus Taylorbacteria bacterium]|nr:Holliday junction branch migration protein RuvA [Candidatus Taylorbacteria bacterium]
MIGSLTGTVIYHDLKYIILNVGGVGYKVYGTPDVLLKTSESKNTEITLWTYLVVRDTALDLYGFTTRNELSFFELLITVSGIGPKTALGILSVASIDMIQSAIHQNDTSLLTKVSGIGKKNAEKIVLELKDKVDDIGHENNAEARSTDNDTIEALKSLGYSPAEIRDALKKIDRSVTDTGARVKAALKILN